MEKTLGSNVRRFRNQRQFSQEELSDRAGIHCTFLGHIERGTKYPSFATLCRLASALNVKPSQLLGGIKIMGSSMS